MTADAPIPRYADPADPLNDASHHTGKPCIEKGCNAPAGTTWSPHWCQPHNAERMARISRSLAEEVKWRAGETA